MPDQETKPRTCTHCGQGIGTGRFPAHASGDNRHLQRCAPHESGLPYGYNAHAVGTPCESPCLGAHRG